MADGHDRRGPALDISLDHGIMLTQPVTISRHVETTGPASDSGAVVHTLEQLVVAQAIGRELRGDTRQLGGPGIDFVQHALKCVGVDVLTLGQRSQNAAALNQRLTGFAADIVARHHVEQVQNGFERRATAPVPGLAAMMRQPVQQMFDPQERPHAFVERLFVATQIVFGHKWSVSKIPAPRDLSLAREA